MIHEHRKKIIQKNKNMNLSFCFIEKDIKQFAVFNPQGMIICSNGMRKYAIKLAEQKLHADWNSIKNNGFKIVKVKVSIELA